MVAVSEQYQKIQEVVAQFPEIDGGLYFSETSGELVVRWASGTDSSKLRAAVESLPSAKGFVRVRYDETPFPMARLRRASEELRASSDWAGAAKDSILSVRLDEYRAVVRIDVSADEVEVRQSAQKLVNVPVETKIASPPTQAGSRRNDSIPWNNGTAIWSASQPDPVNNAASCTAGWHMKRGSVSFMATAAHCVAFSNNVYRWHGTTQVFRSSSTYSGVGGIDASLMALVPITGQTTRLTNATFWGGPDTSDYRRVTAANSAAPAVGSAAYVSGANGGLVYAITKGTDPCVLGDGVSYTFTTMDTGVDYILFGDSGSPVARWNTSTSTIDDITAVGILNCTNSQDTAWILPIQRIAAFSGATVSTVP
jgi:adenosine/AMP kinase